MEAAQPVKRLPLRAYVENGREKELTKAWSEGHTFFSWDGESVPPRPFEKPIEEMNLDELCGGNAAKIVEQLELGRTPNYGEPPSESRRSFLENGIGVKSLNRRLRKMFGDESESVELINLIPDDPDRNDNMYRGVQYVLPDPAMRERILKEQQYAYSTGDVCVALRGNDDGTLRVDKTRQRWFTKEQFIRAAKSLLATYGNPKDEAELQYRIDLIHDVIDYQAVRFRDAYAPEEQWRFTAEADPVWHSAFDEYGPAEDHEPGDPWVFQGTHFRRPKPHFDPQYDLWHRKGRDQVEFEIGFDSMSDDALEEMLGMDATKLDTEDYLTPAFTRLDEFTAKLKGLTLEELVARMEAA